jgi:hypothetical protein
MSGIYINDSGTWRTSSTIWVNDAGTWRQIQQVWVNDGGIWRQLYTAFTSSQSTFTSGSGSVTVPFGANSVIIEAWGGGGGASATGYTASYAAGGGSGAYVRSQYSCSGGQTLNYSVGTFGGANVNNNGVAGTASTVTSGTLAITSISAGGGSGASGSGAGGIASGGNQVNTNGNPGTNLGAGGVAPVGVHANNPATYGKGGTYNVSDQTAGLVSFYFHQ